MIRFRIYFLLVALLIGACKKDKPVEEPNDDPIASTNYIIDISSQWTVRGEWQLGAPYPYDDYYFIDTTVFYFEGDTSMSKLTAFDFDSISNYPSSNNYYKLRYLKKQYEWCLTNENPSTSPGTLTTSSGTACYIRQDTVYKRVYVAKNEDSYFPMLSYDREYVLYDFNLNVTDTLPYNAWNGGVASNNLTVDTVEYMMIDGKSLKAFKVYENNSYYYGTIIEGIGSLHGFINNSKPLIHFQNNEIDFYPAQD